MLIVLEGYTEWIATPERAKSPELDFGVWWKLYPDDPPPMFRYGAIDNQNAVFASASASGRWRVSWIDDTGELYAKHLACNSDKFIVLGRYPTREAVEARMAGWSQGGAKALSEFFGA